MTVQVRKNNTNTRDTLTLPCTRSWSWRRLLSDGCKVHTNHKQLAHRRGLSRTQLQRLRQDRHPGLSGPPLQAARYTPPLPFTEVLSFTPFNSVHKKHTTPVYTPTSGHAEPRLYICVFTEVRCFSLSVCVCLCVSCVCVCLCLPVHQAWGEAPVVRVQWTVMCAGSRPPSVGSYLSPAPFHRSPSSLR